MSDDLSAFFAKKKDKKKKNAVQMDDVGQILERKARRQEERDEQFADDEKRNDEDGYRGGPGEESEWIEYGDANQGRLEGLKIKDMGVDNEAPEEENVENEEKEQQETTKTWGAVEQKKNDDDSGAQMLAAFQTTTKKSVYVAPSRRGGSFAAANIDVTNEELFPTLAAASEIEKNKKEDTKPGQGWGTVKSGGVAVAPSESRPSAGWGGGAPLSASRGKESALAAVKSLNAGAAPAAPPIAAAPKPAPTTLHKTSNSYVPPHLRNKS